MGGGGGGAGPKLGGLVRAAGGSVGWGKRRCQHKEVWREHLVGVCMGRGKG